MGLVENKKDNYRITIERFALIAGIIQPLISIPQIIQIYSSQSAADVSLLTWVGYLVFAAVFLAYGLTFKLTPIWVTQIIWIIMEVAIIVGILLYS